MARPIAVLYIRYCRIVRRNKRAHGFRITDWDEEVGNLLFVLGPCFTVLVAASSDVSTGAMDDHDHEEDKVKPRKRASVEEIGCVRNCHRDMAAFEATYPKPVTRPHDIEKNMSGT